MFDSLTSSSISPLHHRRQGQVDAPSSDALPTCVIFASGRSGIRPIRRAPSRSKWLANHPGQVELIQIGQVDPEVPQHRRRPRPALAWASRLMSRSRIATPVAIQNESLGLPVSRPSWFMPPVRTSSAATSSSPSHIPTGGQHADHTDLHAATVDGNLLDGPVEGFGMPYSIPPPSKAGSGVGTRQRGSGRGGPPPIRCSCQCPSTRRSAPRGPFGPPPNRLLHPRRHGSRQEADRRFAPPSGYAPLARQCEAGRCATSARYSCSMFRTGRDAA